MALDARPYRAKGHMMSALELAIFFHDTYERLAPQFGYVTRLETLVFDPTTPNGRLMVAVCYEVLEHLVALTPAPGGD